MWPWRVTCDVYRGRGRLCLPASGDWAVTPETWVPRRLCLRVRRRLGRHPEELVLGGEEARRGQALATLPAVMNNHQNQKHRIPDPIIDE